MERTGKQTKTWTFNTLKSLTKRGLLIEKDKANIKMYRLDLGNPQTVTFLQLIDAASGPLPCPETIAEIQSALRHAGFTMIIFGSRASSRQNKDSDLDIFFLIGATEQGKRIKPYINEIKLKSPMNIDDHYVTHDEFIEMLSRPSISMLK